MQIPFFTAVAGLLGLVQQHAPAESDFIPARPPAAPLAVRSPYLNAWLNGRRDGKPSGYLAGQWPQFWSQHIQGWQGFIVVDGKPFNWMGGAPGAPHVKQESLEYTSTKTTFVMNVDDKVQMNIEFLSPVYHDDLRRQSVTSSYLNVAVKSLDGREHSVSIYSDVTGEWASGDNSAIVEWDTDSKDGVRYHKFYRRDQQVFKEQREVASWGNWYWAIGDTSGVSYQIGADTIVRKQFREHGKLTGKIDKEFRAVNNRWPVFALSRDLGSVGKHWKSTLFTIGYTQEESILFQGKEDEPRKVPSLWKEWFSEDELVTFFYHDYKHATWHSGQLDHHIAEHSKEVAGQDYLTITSLGVRQVFGALAYTGTKDDILVFLKEISSNSDIQTVDVLFPALPIMLYLNPDLIRWTLDPLLENDRYRYPNHYAQHDLGTFPNAVGHPRGNDEKMPLEECGNMIIMMLSYAQKRPHSSYLHDNWDLLQRWAQYLIEEAKIPADQLSTDDFAGHLANQTNLAIKGIIALRAMSEISHLTGHYSEEDRYMEIATEYLDYWSEHTINNHASPKRALLQYGHPDTYGILYNIYSDKLLGLDFIPQHIYDMQSDFYLTIQDKYGVVLDTRGRLTKVDWELFAAAVAKPETRDMFISKVAKWIDETPTWRAFTDLYDPHAGGYPGNQFTARPVVGGVFSLLVLDSGLDARVRAGKQAPGGSVENQIPFGYQA